MVVISPIKYSHSTKINKKNKTVFTSNNCSLKPNPYNDGIDDGKISFPNSLRHFVKGTISPFKNIFNSPKALAISALTITGGALLCSALPPLLPILTAIGLTTGAVQLGIGGYKVLTAQKDKEAENAWEKIGMGAFSLGTSAIGAKSALKASGIENTKQLSIFQACVKCFKEMPSSFSKTFKMVQSKTAWTNLRHTFKKIDLRKDVRDIEKLQEAGYGPEKLDEIQHYAEMLHEEGIKMTQGEGNCIEELKSIFPEPYRDKITYRVKSVESIRDKLLRKLTGQKRVQDQQYAKNLIEQIKGADYTKNNNLTPEQIIALAESLRQPEHLLIESLDDARSSVFDLIGTRLVVDKIDDTEVRVIVDSLAKGLREGKIEFEFVKNYRGKGVKPYFNIDDLDTLAESASIRNKPFYYRQGVGKDTKSSGYTTAQMITQYPNGALAEFQIRGRGVNEIARVEHLPYDIRMGKDINHGSPILDTLYKNLIKHTKQLSEAGYDSLNNYLTALYKYYRNIELGKKGIKIPVISDYLKSPAATIEKASELEPAKLQKIFSGVLKHLDINNIENLHEQSLWLRTIPRVNFLEQMARSTQHQFVMDNIISHGEIEQQENV